MAEPLTASPWQHPVSLLEARRGTALQPVGRHLEAGEADRERIAKALGLEGVQALDADLNLSAWRDGVRIEGAWRATITQICGVSLDPFETSLTGAFEVTAVPEGSALAEAPSAPEIAIDPLAEDPPDVLTGDQIDLGAYVVEQLALDIDPFPRKPGVVFEAPVEPPSPSPFAALSKLRDKGSGGA